jgi:hypothetical protein
VDEREKIVDYWLSFSHRYGASKARFFAEFGFLGEEWEQLSSACEAARWQGLATVTQMPSAWLRSLRIGLAMRRPWCSDVLTKMVVEIPSSSLCVE